MRVLVISHLYPAPHHPRHLFVHEQVTALRDLGLEMRVLSPTGWTPAGGWRIHSRLRRRRLTPPHATLNGIEIDYPRVPVLPRMAFFAASGDLMYAAAKRRIPHLRSLTFDLVHAHQALPDGALAQRLAAELGAPYVITVHGRDVNYHLRQVGPVATRTASALNGAAAVVAVSRAVARRLQDVVAAPRLHVIVNGISVPEEKVAPADFAAGRTLLLSVGYLTPTKGHDIVLEALARLVGAGHDDLEWAIVGEGARRARLEARASELGLQRHIHWLGRLPHKEVLAMMARADAFVLPSAPEGFGLVYAEALSQGTPVLACRGEGPEDFVEDGVTGRLVAPGDVAAVAQAITSIVTDPEIAGAVGERGPKAVASLRWEDNARRQKLVYEQVVERVARGGRP